MEEIYREIVSLRQANRKAVLATIITKLGPAPREKGAKLLIREDGSTLGSISGGCVEAEVWQAAMASFKDGMPRVIGFHLTEKEAVESGLICGGRIEVYLDPLWRGYGSQEDQLYQELLHLINQGGRGVLATLIQRGEKTPQGKLLIKEDQQVVGTLGDHGLIDSIIKYVRESLWLEREGPVLQIFRSAQAHELEVYLEPISPTPVLYIFGGGHISLPLVRMGRLLGFRVVVIDDRELYANRERFPEADEVYAMEFSRFLDGFNPPPFAYIVIVTRGHQYDELVLEKTIRFPVSYIGMIGSKRKVRRTYDNLRTKGIDPAELERVHAPIGLDIGAETPEEIAVSILAELIKVRRRSPIKTHT